MTDPKNSKTIPEWDLREECCICGEKDHEDNMEKIQGEWYCMECEIKDPNDKF